MRSLSLLALCVLPGLVPSAWAAPTLEEQALRAALDGRSSDAVRLLDGDDATMRWTAGRHALLARDFGAAARLFGGTAQRDVWGRVDLAAARGDLEYAAGVALTEMSHALAGVHRDALGTLLVGWARERAVNDPDGAARFLLAATGLLPSPAVRRDAEDALFRLPPHLSNGAPLEAARRRLAEEPANVPARLRVAMGLAQSRPGTAAASLVRLTVDAERPDALAAATHLVGLDVPDPLVLDALAALGARFPEDPALPKLRLDHAIEVAMRDPDLGIAAIALCEAIPSVATEAREARASATLDPATRRALWLAIAAREGASARGDAARQAAFEALLEGVRAAPPDLRAAAAAAALQTRDGAGTQELLYLALPEGTDALWAFAERFPEGAWCDDLGDRLIATGTNREEALRYASTCTSPSSVGGSAVYGHAVGTTRLHLAPLTHGVAVTASAAAVLHVSQHRVDPEALFRATEGHPLNATLDAFLLDPDLTWEVPQADGLLETIPVVPRGGGPLTAITIRAGDQRATALVVADPLDVQVVRRGADTALAVLRDGAGVGGAELLVLDAAGGTHRARTDVAGVVLLHELPHAFRVMVRKGNALGFATASAPAAVGAVADTWSIVPWDRAVPADGAVVDVSVFGSRPAGDAGGAPRLQSRDANGNVLEEVPLILAGGVAKARLFAMGRGSLVLVSDDTVLTQARLTRAGEERPLVRITWTPASARPGDRVVATIVPLEPPGPGGLAGEVTVSTGWSTTTTPLVLGAEGASFPFELTAADDPERLAVTLRLPDGRSWSSGPSEAPARAVSAGGLPAIVKAGAPFTPELPAGSWIRASSDDGAVRWARAGAPILLPTAGNWALCAWDERCGPDTSVIVAEGAVGSDGRWSGAPTLTVVTAEGIRSARIVRAGDALLVGDARGTRAAWVQVAAEGVAPLPLRGADTPDLAVAGSLSRGGTSTLDVGAGLPPGTKIWAFLRDAADMRRRAAATVAIPWSGDAGTVGDAWAPEARWGEAIAAALLEEEERLAEVTDMERVDFGFSAAAEVGSAMGLGGLGTRGYGSGGGGSASHSYGFGSVPGGATDKAPAGDPRAIGVIEAAAPGPMRFGVPTWIASADLELVARLPDGRWSSRMVRLDVGGAPLTAMTQAVAYVAPDAWDGTAVSLLPLALTLPVDARTHALAALAEAGVPGADPALRAAWSLAGGQSGPSSVLARTLTGGGATGARGTDLDALPDLRRADRAIAALSLAAADPDRAKPAAARLLRPADLEPWARARAGLALHVAGAPEDARAALVGDEPVVAAARAVVLGKADARFASAWWTTVRSDAADPSDRALALHALTLLPASRGVAPANAGVVSTKPLVITVEAPLATWRGETFPRGRFVGGTVQTGPMATLSATSAPAGRAVPLWVAVPAYSVPTRLACPAGAAAPYVDLPPSAEPRSIPCRVTRAIGASDLVVRWFAPDGGALAEGRAALPVEPARDSTPTDPMSPRERLIFGLRLAGSAASGNAGPALLEEVLAQEALPAADLERASTAILAARRVGGEPKAIIEAFQAYREHVPGGALDLDTAAALARAYASTGDPKRALAATRVVMDARFKEELGAVSQLQDAGLGLTALKLLRELVDRYPEVPTVVSARYLAPSMLLGRAEGDGDRLGYTRSSLRHTAAAELATFLLLHPDAKEAPEAAALLVDALHALDDPARERALAGPLARRYRDGAAAWRLSLADARATLAAGQAAAAYRILEALEAPPEGASEVDLERGRALEALGRLDDARAAYDQSGSDEASERRGWLDREDLALPTTLVLTPGAPARVKAHLRPGAEVTVTAIRVLLEAALLRDAGTLDAASLSVAGLKPTASRTVTVGIDGDIPLPALPDGAYVVTVTSGATTGRMVVVRTDAEVIVESRAGSATLVHVTDTSGRALPDTQLWLFDGGGTATTARTDGEGAAFVPYGGGALGVLARLGDRYALANLGDDTSNNGRFNAPPNAAPATKGYGDVLRKNEAAYDQLFQQDARQVIEASSL
ncbi:MAG: hypothetical protein Q8P18_04565 [Pseudomonadota bacterium]|nr:hypothetical protein [Pseudomonadota bacterium]